MVSSTVRDESEKVATQTDIPTNTETTISHTHTQSHRERQMPWIMFLSKMFLKEMRFELSLERMH
jgi:hypothetical protein